MAHHKYTIEQLENAVKSSNSIAQTLAKLGIVPAGGNYYTIKKRIKEHNIDTSHFGGQSWNRGKITGPKKDISYYLVNEKRIGSYKLKNRLLKEKLFQYKCKNCSLSEWLKQPIPLELHHKDGNSSNNQLDNLELLCPNCHAFTHNYRGKNK